MAFHCLGHFAWGTQKTWLPIVFLDCHKCLPESLTISVCFVDYELLRLFEVYVISSYYCLCLPWLSGSFVSRMSQCPWIYGPLKVSNENSKFELLLICLLSSAFMDHLESTNQVESCWPRDIKCLLQYSSMRFYELQRFLSWLWASQWIVLVLT